MVVEILDHAVRRRAVASNVARLATLMPSAATKRRQRICPASAISWLSDTRFVV